MTIHTPQSCRPAWLPIEERKDLRLPLRLDAEITDAAGDRWPVRITDLSALGCRIVSDHRVTVGRYLTVEVPGFARYAGWVAWCAQGAFGLDFANPVPLEVVGHIVDRGNPDAI